MSNKNKTAFEIAVLLGGMNDEEKADVAKYAMCQNPYPSSIWTRNDLENVVREEFNDDKTVEEAINFIIREGDHIAKESAVIIRGLLGGFEALKELEAE